MRNPDDAELYRMIVAFADEFKQHAKDDRDGFASLNKWMWRIQGALSFIGLMLVPLIIALIVGWI